VFANNQIMGIDMGLPDVCKTPVGPALVPIPYPNIAVGSMGVPAAYNVLFGCAPAHNLSTMVPVTMGDTPGVGLGVVSSLVMGPTRHVTAAFTVLAGGMPATRLTSMSLHNNMNCPGVRLAPSQVSVLLLAP